MYVRMDRCECENDNQCHITDRSWLQLNKCSNTLSAQISEALPITFVGPTVVDQYAHTLEFNIPGSSASWSISASLRVYTSASHFSAEQSRYDFSWPGDDLQVGPQAGSEFIVYLHAIDSYGNLIEAPGNMPPLHRLAFSWS
jgi:hypothetical protein